MKKIIVTATGSLLLALLFTQSYAQPQPGAEHPAKRPHDCWQADWQKDSIPGISLDEANDYLKGRKSKTIVVAILDNCVDTAHISIGGSPSIGDHIKELKEAYNYAREHGVLIVHAAGNEGVNMDNEKYDAEKETGAEENDGGILVGATTTLLNDNLVSFFSNYGEQSLDLFAPGSAIYTTAPGNQYSSEDGTSFSCPIVVGVAALLKSYFPSLTSKQLKEILMKSVYKPELMVIPPMHAGVTNKIPFSKMSKSGGIVNAYNAVKLADELYSARDKKVNQIFR